MGRGVWHNGAVQNDTYEDQFSRAGRRLARLVRPLRWRLKSAVGKRRVILVELRWRLGDEIMALPIFEALRDRYPGARVAVWTNYPALFEGNPCVDSVNEEGVRPDRYILLRGAPRTVCRVAHYAYVAGVPAPKSRPALHLETWKPPARFALAEGEGPVVAVAAGASWASKRWPLERWRALCGALEGRGVRLVELGMGHDAIGAGLCLVDKTSVREAACVLRGADLLVCCDSGLMHLALAAGAPVVALFGPTDPAILVRGHPDFCALRSSQSCSGFWNRARDVGAPGVCPENHACCLETITVADVLGAVDGLLSA